MIGPIELTEAPSGTLDERATLIGFIDYFRSVLARKLVGLDQEQLATRVGASSLTLAGLLKHMAGVEDHWFTRVWSGLDYPEPWATEDDGSNPDWDFDSAAADVGKKWLSKVNDIGMVVDLGPLKRMMMIKGKFNAEKGSAPGFIGRNWNSATRSSR